LQYFARKIRLRSYASHSMSDFAASAHHSNRERDGRDLLPVAFFRCSSPLHRAARDPRTIGLGLDRRVSGFRPG